MCRRHSFCLTRAALAIDGCGLTESHTAIMQMHGLSGRQYDASNLYEWQPPQGWPEASYAGGLIVDRAAYETKARHEAAIARHVKRLYPDVAAWAAPDPIRWAELPLPDAERVQRAYDLALRAQLLGAVNDEVVLSHVNRHLEVLGCAMRAAKVASLRASLRASVWDSLWDSLWASVWASMVLDDSLNPWRPLAELATHGAYLYGVADDGTAYVLRELPEEVGS